MKKFSFVVIFNILFFIGCQPTTQTGIVQQPEMQAVFYLSADVLGVDEDLVTIKVEKPSLSGEDKSLADQLAQNIIESCYLLESMETTIDQTRVTVEKIRGNNILLRIPEKIHSFKPGRKVRVPLVKKTIAIRDFEVIMGRNKEVAPYVQEDITTTLVNSGQFNVVERLKLQSLLEELKLSQTGLINPKGARRIGKLIGADAVLTGTLAATGDLWNINLRLINVETGFIIAAFNKKGSLHELQPEAFRQIGQIAGGFEEENPDLSGWDIGKRLRGRTGMGGHQQIYIDETQGANGTNKSLAMDFELGSKRVERFKAIPIQAAHRNILKRDLNNYRGVTFYIKATEDFTLAFMLMDSQKGTSELEIWFTKVLVTTEWNKINIPFNTLSLSPYHAKRTPTNHTLELQYTEQLQWLIHEGFAKRGTRGTIWLDEVSFY